MTQGTDERVVTATILILVVFLTLVGFALELAGVSSTGTVLGVLVAGLVAPLPAQRVARWLVSRRDR